MSKCVKCGAELGFKMVPTGSGMLETHPCPNGCRVSQGIGAFLEIHPEPGAFLTFDEDFELKEGEFIVHGYLRSRWPWINWWRSFWAYRKTKKGMKK